MYIPFWKASEGPRVERSLQRETGEVEVGGREDVKQLSCKNWTVLHEGRESLTESENPQGSRDCPGFEGRQGLAEERLADDRYAEYSGQRDLL